MWLHVFYDHFFVLLLCSTLLTVATLAHECLFIFWAIISVFAPQACTVESGGITVSVRVVHEALFFQRVCVCVCVGLFASVL